MQIIIRIIGFFIGLFVIINGIWVILTPPLGDELLGCVVIAAGIIIALLVQYVAMLDNRREA